MQENVGVVGVIGFIGLGAMGLPIACRLARAGFRLAAFDTDPQAVEAARAEGRVQAAGSPRAVVEASDVLITCLPNPRVVEAVYGEVAASARACSPATARRSGPRSRSGCSGGSPRAGVRYLECPMLGGPARPRAAQLFFVVSGDEDDIPPLPPLLDAIGRGRRFVGGPGQASRIKVVQNGLGLVQAVAIGEALAILAKAGADLASLLRGRGRGPRHGGLRRCFAPRRRDAGAAPAARDGCASAPRTSASRWRWPPSRACRRRFFRARGRAVRRGHAQGLGESDIAALARAIDGARAASRSARGPAHARAHGRDRDRRRPDAGLRHPPRGRRAPSDRRALHGRARHPRGAARTWRGGSARSATTCCCRTCSTATAGPRSIRRCCRREGPTRR